MSSQSPLNFQRPLSFMRPLRGHCACGRNHYIIHPAKDAPQAASVLFDSSPSHRASQASLLGGFLRVPLEWYRSATFAYYPDETNSMIHKVYTSPREQHAMRHFCGFCGTPLTYWSESPRSEADFIQITLGSLRSNDLNDLEEMDFLPGSDDAAETPADPAGPATIQPGTSVEGGDQRDVVLRPGRETVGGLPWFDTLVEGSRLGNLRHRKGSGRSRDGTVRVEWEIMEYTEDDGDSGGDSPRSGKRKFDEREESNQAMQGVEQ
ncbi:hypothetical protein GE09DRAFT_708096 [Coniochaeta sp. 2T2.1]|nr:hypothetical protein GE09DRAFT_708096 [Coniochaeta sp. 2T2.1]